MIPHETSFTIFGILFLILGVVTCGVSLFGLIMLITDAMREKDHTVRALLKSGFFAHLIGILLYLFVLTPALFVGALSFLH